MPLWLAESEEQKAASRLSSILAMAVSTSGDAIHWGGNRRHLGSLFVLLVGLGNHEITLEVLSEECSYLHTLD